MNRRESPFRKNGFLSVLRSRLDAAKIPDEHLDGDTQERAAQVAPGEYGPIGPDVDS